MALVRVGVSSAQTKLDRLADEVRRAGGVKQVGMERVRDACGWDRLGPHVNTDIGGKLDGVGLASVGDLPLRATETVWLYLKQSGAGRTIRAVLHPTTKGIDRLIRLSNNTDSAKLTRLRAMFDDVRAVLDE